MHYIFLKNIIETILGNFVCASCQNKTNEQSVEISGVTPHGIDINIHCHICGTHTHLNAELNTMASSMLENEHGKKYFEEFLKNGGTLGATLKGNTKKEAISKNSSIKDEDILKVHNDLKHAKSIEDLMGE